MSFFNKITEYKLPTTVDGEAKRQKKYINYAEDSKASTPLNARK